MSGAKVRAGCLLTGNAGRWRLCAGEVLKARLGSSSLSWQLNRSSSKCLRALGHA